jgi:hypothetical protein
MPHRVSRSESRPLSKPDTVPSGHLVDVLAVSAVPCRGSVRAGTFKHGCGRPGLAVESRAKVILMSSPSDLQQVEESLLSRAAPMFPTFPRPDTGGAGPYCKLGAEPPLQCAPGQRSAATFVRLGRQCMTPTRDPAFSCIRPWSRAHRRLGLAHAHYP